MTSFYLIATKHICREDRPAADLGGGGYRRALAGPQAGLLRRLRNGAFRSAAANVVLSERMAAVVARAGAPVFRESPRGISSGAQARSHKSRIRVIPNWADMEAIRPVAAADNPLRREWGLADKFVVCYSGNMGRVHEFGTILDAAQLLSTRAEAIGFLFIGGGAQRRMVEDEVRRRRLPNVQFRPYQDRAGLSFSLGVGDLHLVSQRPEVEGYVYPSKLYGILAAGRPLVFIGDREGEISLLVDQLVRLADNALLCEAMGARARAVVRAGVMIGCAGA